MSSKKNIPVPIYDYSGWRGGGKIPVADIPENTTHQWCPEYGGSVITTPGPVTFGTVTPIGTFPHCGVLKSNPDGSNVIIYHNPGSALPINPNQHIHNVMNHNLMMYRRF